MKFKSKIVLFVCAFALIFSVVSVSCFASVSLGSVVFSDYLNTDPLNSNSDELTGVSFSCYNVSYNGSVYDSFDVDGISFSYRGYWAIDFAGYVPDIDERIFVTAYSGGAWTQDTLRSATFSFCSDDAYSRLIELGFISEPGSDEPSVSFYDQIYSSISDGVFGPGADLTPEQVMTLTLISTILSYAFILLPLLLVIGFVLRCCRL